ncbi:hypothetical protein M758_6G148600 [Ceratodon purpureus]|nr:hypothetical protein M758_6G148600 [Ceratodon purpureus]
MAAMLAAMPTCHLPRRLVARDGVLRHGYAPVLSLCSGSDLIRDRGRLLMVDARGCGGGGRVCCDGRTGERDCAPAVGGDCSLEPSDAIGRDQEVQDAPKSETGWESWQMNACQLRDKVSKLGRAGLLAYGLFSGIIYTTFFFIAFLAFEKSTGQNPANNLKGCLGGMVTMWTGNNFTRPLRVAGAAAMAPCMDKVLKKTQKVFKFEDESSAFLFLVILLFAMCGVSVGLLILSRMGR